MTYTLSSTHAAILEQLEEMRRERESGRPFGYTSMVGVSDEPDTIRAAPPVPAYSRAAGSLHGSPGVRR